ncbi:MAG TPA: hypothetical protein VJ951_11670, partial [Bacteroidales bacterium]|nr:hypothetical protein [Bacteroidales bacterium]
MENTAESLGLVSVLLSIVVLIVFFVMAARLKKIMENTDGRHYGHKVRQFYHARACELAGDKQNALILYYQVLWRFPYQFNQMNIKKEDIQKKIKELGGDP